MIRLIASLRLTLLLLIVLAAMSVIGTLAPRLNIYYNPVFMGVLFLLAANITVCATRRLTRMHRTVSARNAGYLFSHLGVLLILAGSAISLILSTRVLIWFEPGQPIDTIPRMNSSSGTPLGFELILDKFRLELHDTGMPAEFASDLNVRIPGKPEIHTTITVNNPLKVKSFHIYQSSYRLHDTQTVLLSLSTPAQVTLPVRLEIPGPPVRVDIPEIGPVGLSALHYEPDFVVGQGGTIGSRSYYPRNPAVRIAIRDDQGDHHEQWYFQNFPDVHHGQGWRGLQIRLESVDQVYDSGLEIVRDPGTAWVAAGAILLVVGLFLYLLKAPKPGGVQ